MKYKIRVRSNLWQGGKLLLREGRKCLMTEEEIRSWGVNTLDIDGDVNGNIIKKICSMEKVIEKSKVVEKKKDIFTVSGHMAKSELKEGREDVKVCLNVGCGKKIKRSNKEEHWFNLDVRDLAGADFVADIRNVAFGGLDIIEARDVIEHFDRKESRQILAKLVGWMDGGGKIIIQTPDLRHIWKEMQTNDEWCERISFGGQDYEENYHRCGWTRELLKIELDKLGVDIIKESYQTKTGQDHGNLYIEGIKRGGKIEVGLIAMYGKRWLNMGIAYLSDCVYWLGGLVEVLGKPVSMVGCEVEEGGYTKRGNLKSDGIYVADWEVPGSVQKFVEIARERRIKILFIWESRFNMDVLKVLREICDCMVIMTNDYQGKEISFRNQHFQEVAKVADAVITTSMNGEWGGKEKNICVRQGVNWENWRVKSEKKIGIAFVGNMRMKERQDYLLTLADKVGVIDCFSQDYEFLKNKFPLLRMHPSIDRIGMRNVCAKTKILVGDKFLMRGDFIGGAEWYWSNRVYQVMGSGGFFVTPYIKGLEKEFKNKEHLVWAKSFNDMVQEIKYYLEHDKEREEIANRGYDLVHAKYKYVDRIREMVMELRKRGEDI